VIKAMLWRAKINIFRNKKGALKALQMTLTMMFFAVLFMFLLGSSDVNIEAQNYVTVTSSGNLTNGSNFFADPTISTTFSLPNCISQSIGGNTIAYIAPQTSSAYYSQE
jgi:hypothetical protein